MSVTWADFDIIRSGTASDVLVEGMSEGSSISEGCEKCNGSHLFLESYHGILTRADGLVCPMQNIELLLKSYGGLDISVSGFAFSFWKHPQK